MSSLRVIGFAGQYYTAWNITEETVTIPFPGGQRYVRNVRHEYVQNLSKNLEEAKKKWPDADVDMSLRGTSAWVDSQVIKEEYEPDTFHFGRYRGKKVDEVDDLGWLYWFFGECTDDRRQLKEAVAKKLVASGQYRNHVPNRVNSSTDLLRVDDPIWDGEEKLMEFMDELASGKPVRFMVNFNPDENGDIIHNGVRFRFPDVRGYEYQGWPYYLPVVDGKSKRIKNKEIVIDDFVWCEDEMVVKINHFKICK